MSGRPPPDPDVYAAGCRAWLVDHAKPRPSMLDDADWGEGSDDVSVFHNLTFDAERDLLERAMAWQQKKFDAGYGAITWAEEDGGAGLPKSYEQIFRREEAGFETPEEHETLVVTVGLVAPTVRRFGTAVQHARFVRRFLRAEELCCQLFSEPTAGSDLAALGTRAERDGDEWIINGQKVWTSGAQFSGWGELIARTDPDVPKHAGMTAFLVPLDRPGVEVRPLRQMSGGSSFSEVFLSDVRISDDFRLGEIGQGWRVALTTLGFERDASGGAAIGGSWLQVLALARWLGATGDAILRQRLADLYIQHRVTDIYRQRARSVATAGRAPGPEGSIGKLRWTRDLAQTSDVVSALLGPRLVADTGEWGTYAWSAHLLGAPGFRIAGGTDEVQRTILGERILGLPTEARPDRIVAWRDAPR